MSGGSAAGTADEQSKPGDGSDTRKRTVLETVDLAAGASLVFFVVLILGMFLTGASTVSAELIVVALVPLVVFLVFAGSVEKVKLGSVEVELRTQVRESVSEPGDDVSEPPAKSSLKAQLFGLEGRLRGQPMEGRVRRSEGPMAAGIDSMGDDLGDAITESTLELRDLRAEIRQSETQSRRILSLRVGDDPYPTGLLCLYLTEYTGLRYVTFRTTGDIFAGVVRVEQFRSLLRTCGGTPVTEFDDVAATDTWDEFVEPEGEDDPLFPPIGALIQTGRILEYETVVTETLSPTTARGEALEKMNQLDRDYLPVVEDGTFVGVVSRGQLLSELFPLTEAPPESSTRITSSLMDRGTRRSL